MGLFFCMKHKDGSFRFKDWNYSDLGLYFLTICTHNKECFFGEIDNDEIILNEIGKIAQANWLAIDKQFPSIETANFVIIPNHLHGILIIDGIDHIKNTDDGNENNNKKSGGITGNKNPMLHRNISTAVRGFKGKTTFDCRKINSEFAWQPRFYDHVIRSQTSFIKIQDYIENNPKMWNRDRNYGMGIKM